MADIVSYVLAERNRAGTRLRLAMGIGTEGITFGSFAIAETNGYEVLKKVKEQSGFQFYFRGETLHAQLRHLGEARTPPRIAYDFTRNIERAALTYVRAAQRKVAVRLKAIQKDHTVREVVAGAPGGDSLTLVRYNLTDSQTMRCIAEEEVNKWRYDGYAGSLTGWLLPYCTYGWHARITDPDYPERQGTYLIERVQSRISAQGGQRKIYLGKKVSP